MRQIDRITNGLELLVTRAGQMGAWLAMPMVAIILYDVIGRRFFNTGSAILQDLEWHLHGALFLLCFGWAYLKDAHVRIEILRERWSPRRRAVIEAAGILCFLLPYCALVCWYGYDFVERSFLRNEAAPGGMGLPARWVIKSFLLLSFLLLAAAGLCRLMRCWQEIRGKTIRTI